MTNPFDHLIPNFTIFGTQFTQWWQKLFAGLWALAIIGAGAWMVLAILGLRRATANNAPGQVDEAKHNAVWAGTVVGLLAGLGVIFTVIFAVFA